MRDSRECWPANPICSPRRHSMKAIFATLLLAPSTLAQSAPTVSQLLGTWQIVSIEDTFNDGKVGPSVQFGPHPKGFLMYEPDGHMWSVGNSSTLRRRPPRPWALARDIIAQTRTTPKEPLPQRTTMPNDPSSATAATGRGVCNRNATPPFATAHG